IHHHITLPTRHSSDVTVGNIAATYQFSPKVNLMVRSELAMVQETREHRRPYSTANFQQGYYKEQDVTNYEVNSDMLLTYNEKLGDRKSTRLNSSHVKI